MNTKVLVVLFPVFLISCSKKQKKVQKVTTKVALDSYLPFQPVELKDLRAFQEVSENWRTVGNVYADRSENQDISTIEGVGVLVNRPKEGSKDHLFTDFEHGDIELKVDVLMPKGSNSGLYFQGRYEIQLFDSWGAEEIHHSDMGGVYQRWDDTKEKGKEGFEGSAPRMNAAKAPGLWQHLKIVFHAPEFDTSGKKIENASFEEVWLNGMLIHENVEVTGPTRAAAFKDEKPMGPLMIQGDHGPVALKNIAYKMYDGEKVSLDEITMKEYENKKVLLPSFDSLTPIRTVETDSLSALMATGERPQKILKYEGKMIVPKSGGYLFDLKLNGAGGVLLVDNDTVINRNGDYNLDSLALGKTVLKEGTVPFTFIYNKHRPWTSGFSLEVEGPRIQKHALQAPSSFNLNGGNPVEPIMVEIVDEPIAQRSFLMHHNKKRTHCISVGTPKGIHYAYDLQFGSLLKVWDGDFLDATPMWHSRGPKQLGVPSGFTISFHGSPEFAQLESDTTEWPETVHGNKDWKPMGYELDSDGLPVFSYQSANSVINDKMIVSGSERMLKRSITVNGDHEIWHKVAAGESISKLPDGTYIIENESYYVDFQKNTLNPVIRKSREMDELLVKIPPSEQKIDYNIIW